MSVSQTRLSRGVLALLFLLFSLAIPLGLALILCYLANMEGTAEYKVPAMVAVGAVGSILALTLVTAVLHLLGLTDRTQAWGLPEGSIRAALAITLVVIFAISFVFLYVGLSDGRVARTPPLSGEDLERAVQALGPRVEFTATNPATGTTIISYRQLPTPESVDFAKQGFTALLTLIAAVVSFYFGARTSGAGSAVFSERALAALDRLIKQSPALPSSPAPEAQNDAPTITTTPAPPVPGQQLG